MPAGGNILYAPEVGSGGEGEEIDAAKNSRRQVEKKDNCCQSDGHD